jgi:hypothetical protein
VPARNVRTALRPDAGKRGPVSKASA